MGTAKIISPTLAAQSSHICRYNTKQATSAEGLDTAWLRTSEKKPYDRLGCIPKILNFIDVAPNENSV
jgi:hypothetical protein